MCAQRRYMARVFFLLALALILTACTTPTATPSPQPTMPVGPDVVWDLFIIGDSSLWKLGKAYAAQIEKDVGVQVVLHDNSNNRSSAGAVLKVLQAGSTPQDNLPDALRDADVVVMFVNPEESIDPQYPLDIEQCFLFKAPASCTPESFEQYTADLQAIWAEILRLRDGQPTILRATDLYNPLVSPWNRKNVMRNLHPMLGNDEQCSAAGRRSVQHPLPQPPRRFQRRGSHRRSHAKRATSTVTASILPNLWVSIPPSCYPRWGMRQLSYRQNDNPKTNDSRPATHPKLR